MGTAPQPPLQTPQQLCPGRKGTPPPHTPLHPFLVNQGQCELQLLKLVLKRSSPGDWQCALGQEGLSSRRLILAHQQYQPRTPATLSLHPLQTPRNELLSVLKVKGTTTGPRLCSLASPNKSEACLSRQCQDMLHNQRVYRTHTRQYTGLHTDRASHQHTVNARGASRLSAHPQNKGNR